MTEAKDIIIDHIEIEPEDGHKSHHEVIVLETDFGYRFQLARWIYDDKHIKTYIKLGYIDPDRMVKIMRAVKTLGLRNKLFNLGGKEKKP